MEKNSQAFPEPQDQSRHTYESWSERSGYRLASCKIAGGRQQSGDSVSIEKRVDTRAECQNKNQKRAGITTYNFVLEVSRIQMNMFNQFIDSRMVGVAIFYFSGGIE